MLDRDCLNYHNIWWRYSWTQEDESYTDFGDPLTCNASSTLKWLYLSKIFYKDWMYYLNILYRYSWSTEDEPYTLW